MKTGRVKRKYKKGVEQLHQEAVVEWFELNFKNFRKYLNIASFGENVGKKRMFALKLMGLTPGWPDLFLAIPKRISPNHPMIAAGLFIEMKRPNGRLMQRQKEIHDLLRSTGYQVKTCYCADDAIKVFSDYLKYIK